MFVQDSRDRRQVGFELLRMRTREGWPSPGTNGSTQGTCLGILTARQHARLLKPHQAGKHTLAEIAELFPVGDAVYRALERARQRC
jgi:hypothetical protein